MTVCRCTTKTPVSSACSQGSMTATVSNPKRLRSLPHARTSGREYGCAMFEWSEEHQMIRDAVRQFVEAEVVPKRDELEHGDLPPYDILRKLFATFGMDAMARESFKRRIERERAGETRQANDSDEAAASRSNDPAVTMIPIIELCRHCPGMVTAM